MIGAPLVDAGFVDAGAAYIFVHTTAGWTQQAKLTASNGAAYDYYGQAVAVAGDVAIIGAVKGDGNAPGAGAVYAYVRSGATWTQESILGATNGRFGWSIAVSDDLVLVGNPGDNGAAVDSGSAHVFDLNRDPVSLLQALIDDVQAINLHHGIANSLDAKLDAALGALTDLNQNNDGAAINSLNAFINAVQAQAGKKIAQADADDLIASAQAILAPLQA